ncbi:uncharacterized protein RMCC_5800 [Mycolicibacterium canariasense]|uniref:Uncharacterized protein n=1 Tax=Mycolicibacterium canariasense TaxID=228230 RepID=A0A117IC17_MYCCR|nr:hypothetical protein [Mycolicibacterium canariasense]GAS98835.1 uncharacterized protein RMCC_5800 [Mycolicibacterium canariasense]
MSADRYPTDYIDDEGWARIHRGHNLDVLALRADLAHALGGDVGDDRPVNIVEHHLWEQPRVKWCERHGDPCGMNGDWHRHWHALRPSDSPDTKFTVVRWSR